MSSVEQQVRRARRAMVFWRCVGNVVALPRVIIDAAVAVLRAFSSWIEDFLDSIFYLELDAARRYRALTGSDLGLASGEATRYSGLDPELAEASRKENLSMVQDDDEDDE